MDNNQLLKNYKNRKLDELYISLLCFSVKVPIKDNDDVISTKEVYIFLGTNVQGVRKLVTYCISDNYCKASDWYNLFMSLRDKNFKYLLYANIPNNSYLKEALNLAYKNINIFINCFESVNMIAKYYSKTYSSHIIYYIKNIYLAEDVEGCNDALTLFYNDFSSTKFLVDILSPELEKAKNYYKYTYSVRFHVFSFFFYRDYLKRFRTISRIKPFFETLDDYMINIVPHIKKIETRMYSTKSEWMLFIDELYEQNKELLKKYL